jgi:hypothetical protein
VSTSNAYITNGQLTQWMMNDQTASTIESSQIDMAIDAASRSVEEYCERRFYLDAQTSSRVFWAQHPTACFVDDIGDVTGMVVQTDENGDGVFETTWATTDYQTEPANAIVRNRPIYSLRATRARLFPRFTNQGVWVGVTAASTFFFSEGVSALPSARLEGQQLIQVSAKWGWPSIPEPIVQATLLQAAMIYTAKGAPAGLVNSADLGSMRYPAGLHPQARILVDPYVVNPLVIG